ncbi:hypothetical protein ACF0H5_010671 [Mactra antiquata]
MATNADLKPLCKFGEKCYRKNPQHLKQFRHPKRNADEEDIETKPAKRQKKNYDKNSKERKIDDFFGKKTETKTDPTDKDDNTEDIESDGGSPYRSDGGSPYGDDNHGSPSNEEASQSSVCDDDDDEVEMPESPDDVKENIKQKFLFEMPDDFYLFWEFCKNENSKNPTDALKELTGLKLVGPFDILAGKHKGVTKNSKGKKRNYLLHWRYYYDPPEFQTVIAGDSTTQYHMGYFRDDPNELPALVGTNSAKTDCIITVKGDNLFAAVSSFIDDKLKSKDLNSSSKDKLKKLSGKIKDYAQKNNLSLELKSKRIKEREKKVVCKSFHRCGIVVPVDENEVGYREVPETPADLKKMFKKIVDCKSESERDKHFEPLQELITLVQFANDECDYGEGLELGMDLFCYGGEVFHSTVLQLLPLAYMLLNRPEFGKIIEAHLKHRKHTADLSQLS